MNNLTRRNDGRYWLAANGGRCRRRWLAGLVLTVLVMVSDFSVAENSDWQLKTNAIVTGSGVFLSDVVIAPEGTPLPHLRIADAPRFGTSARFEPSVLNPLIARATQLDPATNWAGAAQVVVNRRARTLGGGEVEQLLTDRLTAEFLPGGGELELRLARPWAEVAIPDEPFETKLLQMPSQGLGPSFTLRLELINGGEKLGSWQVAVRASVWKDVWVTARRLDRGEALLPADLERTRRDLLAARNLVEADSLAVKPDAWELAENLMAGATLNRWSLRPKPVFYRGQMADARVQQGTLSIALRVQVLEDAIPGKSVRVRNPQTKRELQGTVQYDHTILIQL